MPEELWAEAVELASEVGVYAAARGVRVDYGALKNRLGERGGRAGKNGAGVEKTTFVDLGTAGSLAPEVTTTLELVLPTGERLRVPKGAEETAVALLRELRGHGR